MMRLRIAATRWPLERSKGSWRIRRRTVAAFSPVSFALRFVFDARFFMKSAHQQLTEPEASFVQLGFGIPDRTPQDMSDFVVFEPFDVVKKEHFFVSIWQLADRSLKIDAIN